MISVLYKEQDAERSVDAVPLAHLSIELGHLYAEDFGHGNDKLKRHFDRIAPWVRTAEAECRAGVANARARISRCFLVDDYFNRFGEPAQVIGDLLELADNAGLSIDYIAREAGCASWDNMQIAQSVVDRLVSDPTPGTTGARPPVAETGWLCNGLRSPELPTPAAMKAAPLWAPPAENGAALHSIFMDVQLWSELSTGRKWSCPFLASVWQLERLGLLRYGDRVPVKPFRVAISDLPTDWDKVPAILQFGDNPAPFAAYRTLSILHSRFLNVEHAVRAILSQVSVDQVVSDQVAKRIRNEGFDMPDQLSERISYLFMSD